jgi:hypothetical protein
MRIINRLSSLEKQIQIKEKGPEALAVKYRGGQICWNKKIYVDEKTFHSAVNLFFQDAPLTPGPSVIVIRFGREMEDIIIPIKL